LKKDSILETLKITLRDFLNSMEKTNFAHHSKQ